jgi:hypothetical protein
MTKLLMLITPLEPSELVFRSQVTCHIPDMHLELWNLYRKFYLHAWRTERHRRIRCQRCCSDVGLVPLCPVSVKYFSAPYDTIFSNLNPFPISRLNMRSQSLQDH